MTRWPVGALLLLAPKPEWGPAKVVHADDHHVWLIFRDTSERRARRYSQGAVQLCLAPSQTDPTLDNLPPPKREGDDWVVELGVPLEEAISRFLRWFPRGFSDPEYLRNEDYKQQAATVFRNTLGGDRLTELLKGNGFGPDGFAPIRERIAKVIRASENLMDPRWEAPRFLEALGDDATASDYFRALDGVQHAAGPRATEDAYTRYITVCLQFPRKAVGRVTWPMVTLLPALAAPQQHVFIKPKFVQAGESIARFDLRYDPRPNWTTYEAAQKMLALYREKLAALSPRDLLDVYTFMFVAGGGYADAPNTDGTSESSAD